MRKYQYYDQGQDGDYDGYANNWLAQTFTPQEVHMISKVKLKLFRVGDPGTIQVSIRATSSGEPTGGNLCSGTIEGDVITEDSNGEWYEITLGSGYTFEKDVMYAIVVRAVSGDASNKISWCANLADATYSGGTVCTSSDSGVDWGIISGADFMFEEWGAGEPAPTATCWGLLPKSQIDIETIEEAIARLISDHNEDEESHLGIGQSLQSHKASEIIDHVVASIIADKIKNGEVTIEKLFEDKYYFRSAFESLDGWDPDTVGFASDVLIGGGTCVIVGSGGVGDYAQITLNGGAYDVDKTKDPWFQMLLTLYPDTYSDFWAICGGNSFYVDFFPWFGFVWDKNTGAFYAASCDGVDRTKTEIVDFVPTQLHMIKAILSDSGETVKFYLDGVLVATHESAGVDIENEYLLNVCCYPQDYAQQITAKVQNIIFSQDW